MSERGNHNLEDIRRREKQAYIYDDKKRQSADKIAKGLCMLDFNTCIDIGCGTGIYVEALKKKGKEVIGVDGNPDAKPDILADLNVKQDFGKYDLVLSIETAEHIENGDVFANNLVRHGKKYIVMTACPPDRNKVKSEYDKLAHLNEQPLSYWIDKLEQRGLKYNRRISEELMTYWGTVPFRWFKEEVICAEY